MIRLALAPCLLVLLLKGNVASAEGTAADLAGLKPVGWPLGVPLTCHAISKAIQSSLKDSVTRILEFCNMQNEQMQAAGYRSCSKNECVDVASASHGGRDAGQLSLEIGRSEWTDAYYARLVYQFAEVKVSGAQKNGLVCFDPALKADALLQAELDSWDYKRFVEFCVAK